MLTNGPDRTRLCKPCWHATAPETIEAHRAGWHAQCPGEYGNYPGWVAKQCQCDCPIAVGHRGNADAA